MPSEYATTTNRNDAGPCPTALNQTDLTARHEQIGTLRYDPTTRHTMQPDNAKHNGTAPTSLITIKVDNLRARIAADLADKVIERLKQQGATVVVIEEQDE